MSFPIQIERRHSVQHMVRYLTKGQERDVGLMARTNPHRGQSTSTCKREGGICVLPTVDERTGLDEAESRIGKRDQQDADDGFRDIAKPSVLLRFPCCVPLIVLQLLSAKNLSLQTSVSSLWWSMMAFWVVSQATRKLEVGAPAT